MTWFRESAPIRLKMLVAFGTMASLLAVSLLAQLVLPFAYSFGVGLVALGAAVILGHMFREAITQPYVQTVVRMEGLADGDLDGPIRFTEYTDCVGRMTRAMFTFRDAAKEQIALKAAQEAVVREMDASLARLAEGDLTAEIAAAFPPEYAALKQSFNLALGNLRTLIASVVQTADAIRSGTREIAHASEDLARRTQGNAASLEETNAAITQMDRRLKVSSQEAAGTVVRARETNASVEEGRKIVDEAVRAMERVAASASGTTDVIEGLDKIAFQTRVLAMNAAVEAGRAGEAGRGFAVVADLVSALAMRAEEEAQRAREQLTIAQNEALAATQVVQNVDASLSAIAQSVGAVQMLLDKLAAENEAHTISVGEIATAMGTMDQSTQQNAAMVEETSAAARNLDQEVAALLDQAANFQLDAGSARAGLPGASGRMASLAVH